MTPRILRRAPSESTLHKKNMELRQDKLALQEQIRVIVKDAENHIDWLERKYDDLAMEFQESLMRKDKELEEKDNMIERLLREKNQITNGQNSSSIAFPTFEDAVKYVKVRFPLPQIEKVDDLNRYLFNVNDEKRVNPQLKIRVSSGYHLYRHANRADGKAWEDVDEEEKSEWQKRYKQIARIQGAQVKAGLIFHKEMKN
ncbi:hypothetical protein B9Z55_007416 [Caenorhabditis nigoni]|uniref:Uncharacterized protein n=1 Tax=Caenorhabditis nigoni TaxID=1611254 RepID=A0A2G5VA89_9PELO|nr:hypothetical protein B9Z55_007416 [Caenorhabditis nigoni]